MHGQIKAGKVGDLGKPIPADPARLLDISYDAEGTMQNHGTYVRPLFEHPRTETD